MYLLALSQYLDSCTHELLHTDWTDTHGLLHTAMHFTALSQLLDSVGPHNQPQMLDEAWMLDEAYGCSMKHGSQPPCLRVGSHSAICPLCQVRHYVLQCQHC